MTGPLPVTCLVLAAVSLVGFLVWESRQADPLLPMSILRVPTVAAAGVAAVVFYTALLGMLFFSPLYMQEMLGYTPLQSGMAIVPMGLTVVVSSNIAGRIMARTGYRPLMLIGLLLIGVGMLLWARSPLGASYWIDLFPAVVVMSIGQGVAFAALTAGSMAGVPQHQHGVAGGLNVTAQQLGGSVGVAGLVAVASGAAGDGSPSRVLAGYHTAYLVAAGILVAGVVAIAVLLRRRPGDAVSVPVPCDVLPAGVPPV